MPAKKDRRLSEHMEQQITFRDCRIERADDRLTAENSVFRRTWKITSGGLVPQTLEDRRAGRKNLVRPGGEALSPAEVPKETAMPRLLLAGGEDTDFGCAEPHLSASLTADYEKFSVRWEFRIYPGLPLLRSRMFLRGCPDAPLRALPELDSLDIPEKHCRWECVSLRAVTDSHNNLVRKTSGLFYCNETARLTGSLLRVTRTLQNDGVLLIREAPALEEQVRWNGFDFVIAKSRVSAVVSGLNGTEAGGEWIPLYGSALMLCGGGDLALSRALHVYWLARRRFRPDFDGEVFSNTWGDDTGAKNIREAFLEKDLEAAAGLGVAQYQIDAGWDTGETDPATGRSLWKINTASLPQKFSTLCGQAEKLGVTPGAWFVPYTADGNHYACWRRDAETLTELFRTHGMRTFKLDGFRLPDYTSAIRFERMMQLVLENTEERAWFCIDITNWPRTGFFGASQYGSLFLENRYANRANYYPHFTLRNLWQLAPYFPICRVQAEFINTDLLPERYEDEERGDPLAPACCGQLYALACTLFASPLAWMQPCLLEPAERRKIRSVLDAAREARSGAARSLVLPVGEEPDGVCFAGFQAMESETSGWLLLLRGASADPSHRFALHGGVGEGFRFTRVVSSRNGQAVPGPAGSAAGLSETGSACGCSLSPLRPGEVGVTLETPFSFAVFRYIKMEG